MTVEFALDYIPRRMKELGFGDDYLIRWRHFQIDGAKTKIIEANNELYLLIDPGSLVIVKSKAGIYDIGDFAINEMQYEHRGKIAVINKDPRTIAVLFIQVIPVNKTI